MPSCELVVNTMREDEALYVPIPVPTHHPTWPVLEEAPVMPIEAPKLLEESQPIEEVPVPEACTRRPAELAPVDPTVTLPVRALVPMTASVPDDARDVAVRPAAVIAPVTDRVDPSAVAPDTLRVEESVVAPDAESVVQPRAARVEAPLTPSVPPTVVFPVTEAVPEAEMAATVVDPDTLRVPPTVALEEAARVVHEAPARVLAPVTARVLPRLVAPLTVTAPEAAIVVQETAARDDDPDTVNEPPMVLLPVALRVPVTSQLYAGLVVPMPSCELVLSTMRALEGL